MRLPSLCALLSATLLSAAAADEIQRIAFVSCFKESKKAPALATIAEWDPDLFIWMGDNVYGDSEDMDVLRKKYNILRAQPDYARIRAASTVIGTWDDHDYGANDYGKEYPQRVASQQVFLDFLDEPKDSPRRRQEGVYALHDLGPKGQQVRVILLDTRYHRDAIGSDGTILGETQWKWLESALTASPAQVNLLVSSIQVLPREHRFEKWENFPKERARLLALLARPEVPPVVILSGDRHLAEISLDQDSCHYPLYDLTSSSLNHSFGGDKKEINTLRVGENYGRNNFGTLSIDWSGKAPVISAALVTERGETKESVTIDLAQLKAQKSRS